MSSYARGSLAWGACQRCGLRYLLNDLLMDGYFPNIRVCEGCYDAPQPQERLAVVSDPQALWKPALDNYSVLAPILSAVVQGASVVLTWTSIDGSVVRDARVGGIGPYGSAGYEVQRSTDGVLFTVIATLLNTTDEFGALAIETLTYTDTTAPTGTIFYRIRGFDINENAQSG